MSTPLQEELACEDPAPDGWISAASPLVFPQVFGKYVLDRELASGGMARVYLATLRGAVGFEKRLVVKQIRPELASDPAFVRRFVEEAKTAVELSHPNIVPVYELGVEQGVFYIAMEFCAGATLSEILAETGALSPEEGAYVGVEICRALDYAHRRAGIVHRDVTPRNVLVDEEGAVRLIDFGIAAHVTEHGPTDVFGSPGHMPPEQLAGKALTPATDVFAVAALLFEVWTRKPPFRRATARASAEALKQPVPRLDEGAPELAGVAELIARGLSLEPSERPAQAELLARPLRDFARHSDAGDVARRLGARVRRALRRSERKATSGISLGTSTPNAPFVATPALPASVEGSRPVESSGPPPTYTFAARGEVAEWTRRLDAQSSVPPPPVTGSGSGSGAGSGAAGKSGPSTRKLASIAPEAAAPPDAGLEGAAVPAPVLPPRSAPKLIGVALSVGHVGVVLGALALSARAPSPNAHAVVAPAKTSPASAPSPIVTAAVNSEVAPPKALPLVERAALATAPPALGSQRRPAQPSPLSSRSEPLQARTPPASGARDEVPSASGKLRLTADPPASVSLQGGSGVRAFTTPVRELSLAPGIYVVTFRNDTYGMPVVARVNLEAGSERSVHVDFREVEPRVIVR